MQLHGLATLNALLNATCAVLLVAGYICIRKRRIRWHQRFMLSAFVVSVLFLVSYIAHHLRVGTVYYHGRGWTRALYFSILGTHTPLAALVVPLAIVTLRLGLKRRDALHRRWAQWTLPIWLYVSVTGVVVYAMLAGWHG